MRCEWLKRGTAGGDKSLGLSARVPGWAAICAHPQFREFGARRVGGASTSAFKSGLGVNGIWRAQNPP